MESLFTVVDAKSGGAANIECQLTFGNDTETQFWDYHLPEENVWSTGTRMATYWPQDDRDPEIRNPNPDFSGRWNLDESFNIVLYNITSSMAGYFRCGNSLPDGSSYNDDIKFLNITCKYIQQLRRLDIFVDGNYKQIKLLQLHN